VTTHRLIFGRREKRVVCRTYKRVVRSAEEKLVVPQHRSLDTDLAPATDALCDFARSFQHYARNVLPSRQPSSSSNNLEQQRVPRSTSSTSSSLNTQRSELPRTYTTSHSSSPSPAWSIDASDYTSQASHRPSDSSSESSSRSNRSSRTNSGTSVAPSCISSVSVS
jgi:hypothetical protein